MTKAIETVLEKHANAIERREVARRVFVDADADAIGLTNVIREQGRAGLPGNSLNYRVDWLRAAERASADLFGGLLPEATPSQIEEARTRWKLALSGLLAT